MLFSHFSGCLLGSFDSTWDLAICTPTLQSESVCSICMGFLQNSRKEKRQLKTMGKHDCKVRKSVQAILYGEHKA